MKCIKVNLAENILDKDLWIFGAFQVAICFVSLKSNFGFSFWSNHRNSIPIHQIVYVFHMLENDMYWHDKIWKKRVDLKW